MVLCRNSSLGNMPGSLAKLGRPTLTPVEVAQRFEAFLAGG